MRGGRSEQGHLAGLLVHVEGADDALCDLTAGAFHQVLGQAVGQVGLASATGAREDEAPVLEQEADVVLHHGLGDESLEHQAVHTLLPETCSAPACVSRRRRAPQDPLGWLWTRREGHVLWGRVEGKPKWGRNVL